MSFAFSNCVGKHYLYLLYAGAQVTIVDFDYAE